ncbi:uncharacterized protein LOC125528723 [Triticum urartu]|uniref:uncharacterized protein LOC125528723 n=1 Tax=Triticum urartu TaxID=4572 RepID=UPI002044465B|nr:uncharacterized protein LOC125528723 [Triticum urartu]
MLPPSNLIDMPGCMLPTSVYLSRTIPSGPSPARLRASSTSSLDIVPLDHRAAGVAAAAADRFQPIARLKPAPYEAHPLADIRFYLEASRDGLLLLSVQYNELCICNPATRQHAPLHHLHGFSPLEMYPHHLLLHRQGEIQPAMHVFTIGSGQPPRLLPNQVDDCARHLFNGSISWCRNRLLFQGSIYWCTDSGVVVFNTTTEAFRRIHAPVARREAKLFETGDMLGIYFYHIEKAAVDIWVMRGYQSEVWDFKCRVELPLVQIWQQCQCLPDGELVMVVPGDNGELLVLIRWDDWLLQIDIDGKLIASFQPRGINFTPYLLKQTLVQHTFFPTLEGYVVNALPFISPDGYVGNSVC